jgi:hypothetical protein
MVSRSSSSRSSGARLVLADRLADPASPGDRGIAYEIIRFAGMHAQNRALRALLAPGSGS